MHIYDCFSQNNSSFHLLVILIKLPTTLCSALFYCSIIYYIITSNKTGARWIYLAWVKQKTKPMPVCLDNFLIYINKCESNLSNTIFFNFSSPQNFSCKSLMEVSLATLHSTGYTAVLQQCLKAPSRVFSKCNQPRTRHPDSDGSWARVSKSHKTMYNHSSERSIYGKECCACTGSKFSFSNMKTLQKRCMLKTQQLNTHNFLLFT